MLAVEIILWVSIGLVLLTFLVHPFFLWLLSRFINRPIKRDADHRPSFTIFIACYNEAAVIADKLENALTLDYPAGLLEILVADDGSADDTVEIARRFESRGVTVVAFEKNRGKTTVMNELSPKSKGEIIIYSDANTFLAKDALKRFAELFADPKIGCVGGLQAQKPPDSGATGTSLGNSITRGFEDRQKYWEGRIFSSTCVHGGHMAIRKSLYHPAAPEVSPDALLSFTTVADGYRTVYDPTVLAWEEALSKPTDDFRRRARLGLLDMALLAVFPKTVSFWKHPFVSINFFIRRTLRMTTFLWLLIALVASGILSFGGGFYLWMFLAQAAGYLGAIVGWLGRGFLPRLLLMPFHVINNFVALGYGFFFYLGGKRAITWKPRGI
ncbi:glycosyltransferase [bacterium]|nr:glycosyltransferase [bacterium]